MSLFKIKHLVTENIGFNYNDDLSCGVLCTFKPSAFSDLLYIAVNQGDDCLNIYDFSSVKYDQRDQINCKIQEMHLDYCILNIISGFFIKADYDEQIAILHEKSLSVMKMDMKKPSLKSLYVFDFPTSTFSMCSRENFSNDCDLIFVQTVDSNLFCLREDTCLFTLLLFNVLLPSLMCYVNFTESIVFSGSDHCLRSYRYQILSSSCSKKLYSKNPKLKNTNVTVKNIPPSWSAVFNEPLFLLDKYETKECTYIIVVGRNSLYIVNEKGVILISRKLNCTPTHLNVFISMEDSEISNIPKFILATQENYLLVFHKAEIKWCVKTDAPIAAICLPKHTRSSSSTKFSNDLPQGMIPILYNNRTFSLCYLGSYPSTELLQRKNNTNNHEQNCSNFKDTSDMIKELVSKGSIPSFNKTASSSESANIKSLTFQNLIDFGCKIQLDVNFPSEINVKKEDMAKVFINNDPYFKPTKSVFSWDMSKVSQNRKNRKQSLLVTFKCKHEMNDMHLYVDPNVSFTLSYPLNYDNLITKQHFSATTVLPLHLYYNGISISKSEAKSALYLYRLTVKVDKFLELEELYSEFKLTSCNAIEFSPKTVEDTDAKTAVMSRNDLKMYRIQGNNFESFYSIIQDLFVKFSEKKMKTSLTSLKGTNNSDLMKEFIKQMEPFFKILHENFIFLIEVQSKLTTLTKSFASFYQYVIIMQKHFITSLKTRTPCELGNYHFLLDSSLAKCRNLSIQGEEYREALKGCYVSIKLVFLFILNILLSTMNVDKKPFNNLMTYMESHYDALIPSVIMHCMENGYKQASILDEDESPDSPSPQIITGPLELLHFHLKLSLSEVSGDKKLVELIPFFEEHHFPELTNDLTTLCMNSIIKNNNLRIDEKDIEDMSQKLNDDQNELKRHLISPFLRSGDEDSPPRLIQKPKFSPKNKNLVEESDFS